MNAVILACTSLNSCVDAAQRKMHTNYPLVTIDRKYHEMPQKMRKKLMEITENISRDIDTILVAMGFCGGAWENIRSEKRIIIPRVDDCVTLLLHKDDHWYPNLKKPGHLYFRDTDTGEYSPVMMKSRLCEKYGGITGTMIFQSMFANYTNLDMMDTGVYDCYSEGFVEEAQENANLIGGVLDYVEGSNLLLEKLVSGRWDRQFLVVEPGQTLSAQDFLPEKQEDKTENAYQSFY